MKRISSGQGATDFGAIEQNLQTAQNPSIAVAVNEIDNLRACVEAVRAYAVALADDEEYGQRAAGRGVLGILERHGL